MRRKKHIRVPITVALLLALLCVQGVQAEDGGSSWLGSPVSTVGGWDHLPAFTGCGGVPGVPSSNGGYEWEVLRLVNQERTSRGLAPLKRVSSLDDAGRYHAKDMAQDNYFSHTSYDRSGGNLVQACSWTGRLGSYYTGWNSLGEITPSGWRCVTVEIRP